MVKSVKLFNRLRFLESSQNRLPQANEYNLFLFPKPPIRPITTPSQKERAPHRSFSAVLGNAVQIRLPKIPKYC